MELSRAMLGELRDLADLFGRHPDSLQAYIRQDGTCPHDRVLWNPCHECNRKAHPRELRHKLDALRLYLGAPVDEVFGRPTTYTMADVAELRETTVAQIRSIRHRYPAGHPNAFPAPEDPDAYSPWWNADRADELKAWQPTGRGKRATTNPKAPAKTPQINADGPADTTAPAAPDTHAPADVDPLAPLEPLAPVNGRATNNVFRNLQRPKDKRNPWGSVGETFSLTSREVYRNDAMSWLRDNSELSHNTIRAADWNEVFDYFREQRYGTATEDTPAAPVADEPPADPIGPRVVSHNPEHAGMSLWETIEYDRKKAREARAAAKTKAKLDKAYSAPTVTNPATAAKVYVDVAEPGRAIIIGPGFQARVAVDTDAKTRRYRIELSESDTHPTDVDTVIGHARTYADAGNVAAQHHDLTNYVTLVDVERTEERPIVPLKFVRDKETGNYLAQDATWKYYISRQQVIDARGKRRSYWNLMAVRLDGRYTPEEGSHETKAKCVAVAHQFSALGLDYKPEHNEWRSRMTEANARAYGWGDL